MQSQQETPKHFLIPSGLSLLLLAASGVLIITSVVVAYVNSGVGAGNLSNENQSPKNDLDFDIIENGDPLFIGGTFLLTGIM